MDFLERMRSKPRSAKARFAFASALSVTLVVALFWTLSLPARFSEISQPTLTESDDEDSGLSFGSVLSAAKAQLGSVIGAFQGDGGVQDESEEPSDDLFENLQFTNPPTTPATTSNAAPEGSHTQTSTNTPDTQIQERPTPRTILIGTTTRKGPENPE